MSGRTAVGAAVLAPPSPVAGDTRGTCWGDALLILLLPWISISLDPDPILDPRFLLKIAQTPRIRIEIGIRSQDPGSTLENTSRESERGNQLQTVNQSFPLSSLTAAAVDPRARAAAHVLASRMPSPHPLLHLPPSCPMTPPDPLTHSRLMPLLLHPVIL